MIIQRSNVSLAASYSRQIEQTRTERLRAWADRSGGRRAAGPATEARANQPTPLASAVAELHAAAASAVAAAADSAAASPEPAKGGLTSRLAANCRFGVLIALVERLTGRKVVVLDPADLESRSGAQLHAQELARAAGADEPTSAAVGWGIDYELTETRVEAEHTTFSASGRVTTADGREISFNVGLDMSRESVEVTNFRFRAGDAMKDPLVLNFGGAPVALSGDVIDFDLDADGTTDRISFVAGGNGFLVLDRDGNGAVDDGRELFGPLTGDGFAELAGYDSDGNGWIDAGDAVYSQLRIWDSPSGELRTLAERGVGAIGLARVGTEFQMEAGGEVAGAVRETGVWLGEDGSAGTVHHIDLAV